jgi:hypothetical protein
MINKVDAFREERYIFPEVLAATIDVGTCNLKALVLQACRVFQNCWHHGFLISGDILYLQQKDIKY